MRLRELSSYRRLPELVQLLLSFRDLVTSAWTFWQNKGAPSKINGVWVSVLHASFATIDMNGSIKFLLSSDQSMSCLFSAGHNVHTLLVLDLQALNLQRSSSPIAATSQSNYLHPPPDDLIRTSCPLRYTAWHQMNWRQVPCTLRTKRCKGNLIHLNLWKKDPTLGTENPSLS